MQSQHLVRALVATAAALLGAGAVAAQAATTNDQTQFTVSPGSLSFYAAPDVPELGAVTLNGRAQTANAQMTGFAVQDATGTGAGWNVTVSGDTGTGKSPVFKQYCPSASACGTDGPQAYVAAGATLAANSLTLNSTSASFSALLGSTGTPPSLQCASACNLDSPTAVKLAAASTNAGMGTWQATSFNASSLSLATPSNLKVLSNGELYRADLLWSLNTGP